MFENLKSFCDAFLDAGLPGFDLAVYRKGECLLRYMGGYSDLENKIPVRGTERYNMYSCSKVITCTAALQLWEKGLFSLDDKLSDYLPEFENMTVQTDHGVRPAQTPIRIHHLFEMTAGFSYEGKSMPECAKATGGRCPTREAMKYLAREPLCFEPGEEWLYSLCHDVLAAVVEVISGVKFEEYVKTHIFDVLDMKQSTFMLPEEEIETVCPQYQFRDGKPVNVGKHIVRLKFGSEYASGGAGCISTVDDFIRFSEGLRTGKLIKPETLTLMMTDRLTEAQRNTYPSRQFHGYGLGVCCPCEGCPSSEIGWGGAAGSYLAIVPEQELSVFYCAHTLSAPSQGRRSQLCRLLLAELGNTGDWESLQRDLETLYDYHLTY